MTNNKAAKKKATDDEKRRDFQLAMAKLGLYKSLGSVFLIGCTIVGFGYVSLYLPIQVSHGETTTINVAQNWLANLNASVYFAWGTTLVSSACTYRMYRKMIGERAKKDAEISKLQLAIDPKRTSSGLTPEGRAET
jgi:hypothetical protein